MAKKKKKTKVQKKKKLEFSKIIFLCTAILFTLVVIGSFILMWHIGNTEALICLISTTGAMVTTGIGFYYNKSKAENLLKISKEHGLSIDEAKGIVGSTETCYTDSEEV